MRVLCAALVCALWCVRLSSALLRYGHAYQAPVRLPDLSSPAILCAPHPPIPPLPCAQADFTPQQKAEIAANFPVFTVEKRHAYGVYGNSSARGTPFYYNSIKSSTETAKSLKALNPDMKVLMYWNSGLHYNMYECESEVQASWLLPRESSQPARYNYSVEAFRSWWVDCAVSAVVNSDGALDGLFLDAVSLVDVGSGEPDNVTVVWAAMVKDLRSRLPVGAFVTYNGFYETDSHKYVAGLPSLAVSPSVYVESLAKLATSPESTSDLVAFLKWIEASAAANPSKNFMGHCDLVPGRPLSEAFEFGLGVYLLVANNPDAGFFLCNHGYNIDQGMLQQANQSAYTSLSLGAPSGPFEVSGAGDVLSRSFATGGVSVNLTALTAVIKSSA